MYYTCRREKRGNLDPKSDGLRGHTGQEREREREREGECDTKEDKRQDRCIKAKREQDIAQ